MKPVVAHRDVETRRPSAAMSVSPDVKAEFHESDPSNTLDDRSRRRIGRRWAILHEQESVVSVACVRQALMRHPGGLYDSSRVWIELERFCPERRPRQGDTGQRDG